MSSKIPGDKVLTNGGINPNPPPVIVWKTENPLLETPDSFRVNIWLHDISTRPMVSSMGEDYDESSDTESSLVPPLSFSRLRYERGDLPYSKVKFTCCVRKMVNAERWFSDIASRDVFRNRLQEAGILNALLVSLRYPITRDENGLLHLVSRWSTETHTFVTSWGEITPTLLDVDMLLKLPIRGDFVPLSMEFDKTEDSIVQLLKQGYEESKKYCVEGTVKTTKTSRANYLGWIRYWFRDLDFKGLKGNQQGVG